MSSRGNWFIEQRQRHIDWRLLNCGSVCGSDIAAVFGVTRTQGARDIEAFRAERGDVIRYDPKAMAYVPVGRYRSVFGLRPGAPLTVTIDQLSEGCNIS